MLGCGGGGSFCCGDRLRVLLTNDDGFDAWGMRILREIAYECFSEVWVSAPSCDRSSAGGAVSVSKKVAVHVVDKKECRVAGTPVDSVLMGVHRMIAGTGAKPDLVISGINCGANVGRHVLSSGTIGAALATSALGIPSIAVSQEYGCERNCVRCEDWKHSRKYLGGTLRQLLNSPEKSWQGKCIMSINIPHRERDVKGIAFSACGGTVSASSFCIEELTDVENREGLTIQYFMRGLTSGSSQAGDDASLLAQGYIVVTPLGCNITCYDTLNKFQLQ
ncbi:5'/3'-nucleotidase SurE [Anaplasma capra]|uniref:5'/3'-nucleotidase SurE n=1 Tax=Anaplasma capra TaxID=1562740 RepID=UPI0021D5D7BA|nr:5'/3'-nucleotidase SurE [Anaplasma capra]MCU7612107.1 5'/3'-nucleotidase SurE [Anaplasma capra]